MFIQKLFKPLSYTNETPLMTSQTTGGSEIRTLRCEVDRLHMIVEALWSFIQELTGYSDNELIQRITEIDLRDGKLDGKSAPKEKSTVFCHECNRPLSKNKPVCIYCGTSVSIDPF